MKKSSVTFSAMAGAVLLLIFNGCAATHRNTGGELLSIPAGKFYEACDNWQPGQQVSYSFQTSDLVHFDVHYHTKSGKVYPARHEGVAEHQGSFTVEQEAVYCCMWANPHDHAVGLTYEFEVRDPVK